MPIWCHSGVNYKCVFLFCVCVCGLRSVSIQWKIDQRKERMRWGVLCFILLWNLFWAVFLFFFFLLVDRRERAVSSLVYHYDEWPCCGLVTSPAELNQQTTWSPERVGPGLDGNLFSRSSCSSVKLCRLSLTIFISPHRPFFSPCLFPSLFARPYSRTQWHLMPSRTRARAKGPILFSHLFLSFFFFPLAYCMYLTTFKTQQDSLNLVLTRLHLFVLSLPLLLLLFLWVVLFFTLFFSSLKHLTNQITNCPETDTMGTNSIGMYTLKQSHKTRNRLFFVSSFSFRFLFIILSSSFLLLLEFGDNISGFFFLLLFSFFIDMLLKLWGG